VVLGFAGFFAPLVFAEGRAEITQPSISTIWGASFAVLAYGTGGDWYHYSPLPKRIMEKM